MSKVARAAFSMLITIMAAKKGKISAPANRAKTRPTQSKVKNSLIEPVVSSTERLGGAKIGSAGNGHRSKAKDKWYSFGLRGHHLDPHFSLKR